jgi:hypothetical protein
MACEELLSGQKRLVAQGCAMKRTSRPIQAGAAPARVHDFPGVKLTEK